MNDNHIYIISQIIGAIGLILYLVSYQIKSNKGLLIIQVLAQFSFCIQFIMLEKYTGCITLVIMMIRNLVVAYKDKCKVCGFNGWLYILLIAFVLDIIFTWENILSLLPGVSAFIGTIIYFQGNAKAYRAANLFCSSPCWLVYDFLNRSYSGAITEFITIVSILISIYRFGWKNLANDNFEKDNGAK